MKLPREIKLWLIALLLLMPVFFLYFAHFYIPTKMGLYSTGFVQYDQLYYMGLAKEHFSNGFHFFYGTPFSLLPEPDRIYFQPHIFLFAVLQKILPFSPGMIYLIFGFFAALVCMRVVIALYERVVGLRGAPRWLGLILFVWGGGIVALSGFFQNLAVGQGWSESVFNIFQHEPADGWWFLNLGRNLVYPTEAYYHALFLGCILMILNKRFRWAGALMTLLSMSQPFSGLQLILVIVAWGLLEKTFLRSRVVSARFLIFSCGLLLLHLGYYLVFLNQFEEHHELYQQWKIPWILQADVFIPAYLLVGAMGYWMLRRWDLFRQTMLVSSNRLFFVWFLVSFVLANHEFAIEARQPLHFTRGYIWTPLFLLGSGALMSFLQCLWNQKSRWRSLAVVSLVSILFLSDNIAWFGVNSLRAIIPDGKNSYALIGIVFDAMDKKLLDWLASLPKRDDLIVSENVSMGYYVTTYTRHRSLLSHTASTPFVMKRARELQEFFSQGKISPEMEGRDLLVIFYADRKNSIEDVLSHFSSSQEIYRNPKYVVVRIEGKAVEP